MTAVEIKRLRARLQLTQKEFAMRIGVSIRAVKRWEAGESAPLSVFVKKMGEQRG